MESLLRLDDSFDIGLLDRVVTLFYQGHGPEVITVPLSSHPPLVVAWDGAKGHNSTSGASGCMAKG